jgi:hypothetical protein
LNFYGVQNRGAIDFHQNGASLQGARVIDRHRLVRLTHRSAMPKIVRSTPGMSVKIGVLLGDDIGLEVVPECVKGMQAAAASTGLTIDWALLPIGRLGHEGHGQ